MKPAHLSTLHDIWVASWTAPDGRTADKRRTTLPLSAPELLCCGEVSVQ
jgi:hypothetical protein